MSQFDILLSAIADVSKEQTDIPDQGEHQILTKERMGHQVCAIVKPVVQSNQYPL